MPSKSRTTAERIPAMPWERRDRAALTGAWWARGLRLDERCAAVDVESGAVGTESCAPDATQDAAQTAADARAVAEIRWERWRGAYRHMAPDALERQAAAYGCTPEDLRALLAETPQALAARVGKPAWADEVERLVAALPQHAAELPETARSGEWNQGFAFVLGPFIREALRQFDVRTRGIEQLGIVDTATFREEVRQGVARRLVALGSRVLVLELNVLRVTQRLAGDTSADRFWSFVRHCRDRDGLAALLDEYAVLARLLITTAAQLGEAYAEFLHRFAADRETLVRTLFDGVDPGPLELLSLSRGDTHDRSRSVGIARFGSGRQVVYKPRPLGAHRCFNDVLAWYNQRVPDSLSLRTLGVIDRRDYGWVEFVEPAACADAEGATRYFRRQGALLAILHALGGTDFHFENLIAVGDQPVAVDLETLFCPDVPRSVGSEVMDQDPAVAAHLESVGRVGLLPLVLAGQGGRPFDIGGMGGDRDAVVPFHSVSWDGAGTDEMSLNRVLPRLGPTHNRPSLDGVDLDAVQYAGPLLDGFREGYRVLAAGRAELAGPDGLLARFRGQRVRIVARSTREYFVLVNESTHPNALRDALDREQIFGVLWARSAQDPVRTKLIRHEVEDLWAGDVPLFTATVGSRDLRAVGGATIAAVLPESGVDRVERGLTAMDDRQRARQEWIVAAHVSTRVTGADLEKAAAAESTTADGPLTERALAAARAVADRLEASAYRDGRRLGWLGLDLVQQTRWQVSPLSMDLYNGYPGIALFLAQLAHVTAEQRYGDLARDVLRPITDFVEEQLHRGTAAHTPSPTAPPVGAFSGLTGTALLLASAAALLDDAELDAPVVPMLEYVAEHIAAEDGFDVISGAAGVLAVAEALGTDYGPQPHRLAERCVELLRAAAVPAGAGVGWAAGNEGPLLGFSHGAAGPAWALWSHAARTGDARARETAIAALAYENGEFDEGLGNWPDYRDSGSADQYTWCHGAPGVGLARAAMLAADRSEPIAADLRRALTATERFGRYRSTCICHGELGNLELFAAAAAVLPDERARVIWRERASAVVAQVGQHGQGGPICGTPAGIETPGLMTGLAGIGHGLLRIAAPERIPPILLLAPSPRARGPHQTRPPGPPR